MVTGSLVLMYLWTHHFDLFFIESELTVLRRLWKMSIMAGTLVVGLIFLSASQIEVTEFNRTTKQLIVRKSNVFGQKEVEKKNLSQVTDVCIIKRGHDSIQIYTIHYILQISFLEEWLVEVLETNNLHKIKLNYVEVMTFLGKEINFDENVPIIDQSTGRKSEPKSRSNFSAHPNTDSVRPVRLEDSDSGDELSDKKFK